MPDYHERMQSMYMHKAIDNDDLATVRGLLEKNYPLNQPSLRGYTSPSVSYRNSAATVERSQ